jgi:P27 family predicted phage terminase small subunit
MKGRKPKPTYLKLIEGNPGHRPLNLDEPEPVGDLLEPPDTFSAAQRILWQVTLKNAPEGMLRKLDAGVFSSYVVNYAEFLEAAKKVEDLGAVVKMPGGQPMQNPYVSIRNRASAQMIKAAAELGFTPSSRSRVKVAGKKKSKSAFGKLKAFEV